jgi:hypothetical protein
MSSRTKIIFFVILWCYLGILVVVRMYLFLFISQIYSRPIQIHFWWIHILHRQQWSKNPFSYTDEDRRKNTFKRYVFLCIGGVPNFACMNRLRVCLQAASPAQKIGPKTHTFFQPPKHLFRQPPQNLKNGFDTCKIAAQKFIQRIQY